MRRPAAVLLSGLLAVAMAKAADFGYTTWPDGKAATLAPFKGKVLLLYLFSPD